jgi:NADPH:quinone reductase-like Zn-dependent oxidoreductase
MKAIVQETYGNADVLKYADIGEPEPGDDEVLLRVRAAGLDMGTWHLMAGIPYVMRPAVGLRAPKARPGRDVAGRVEAVGANVAGFKPGDRVFGTCSGAFAEYACARPDRILPLPENLTFEQGAAVPTSATSALQALRNVGRLAEGEDVLIIGAGGGVGSFAVQLAGTLGARVVSGVCGPSKAEFVRGLGASQVIDYTREDFTEGPRRYDLILDLAGNRPLSRLRRVLTASGRVVIAGGEGGGRWLAGMERLLGAALLGAVVRHRRPRVVFSTDDLEDLRYLSGLLESGELTPAIGATYPLEEVPEAMRLLAEGHNRGKTVITVA